MSIPVVITHINNKNYLELNIKITSKNNQIILIGDKTLKKYDNFENVDFFDIEDYKNLDINIEDLKTYFDHFSTKSYEFEWFCFERYFVILNFMSKHKLNTIFHCDSDNVLLQNINKYSFFEEVALMVPNNSNSLRMNAMIANSKLNFEFFVSFLELYKEIYVTKNKFNLISEKIEHHKIYGGGGISDMTLAYLLYKDKKDEIQNLLIPQRISGEMFTFNESINSSEGLDSKKQFKMSTKGIQKLYFSNEKIQIYDSFNKLYLNLFNIHFQGTSKKYIEYVYKKFFK